MIFVIFIFISCQNTNSYDELDSVIQDINPSIDLRNFHSVIVLPSDGCPSCIAAIKRSIIESRNKLDSTILIAIRIRDRKFVKEFKNLFSNIEVIVDENNTFGLIQYNTDYPWLLLLSKNEITNSIELKNPADTAWIKSLKP